MWWVDSRIVRPKAEEPHTYVGGGLGYIYQTGHQKKDIECLCNNILKTEHRRDFFSHAYKKYEQTEEHLNIFGED